MNFLAPLINRILRRFCVAVRLIGILLLACFFATIAAASANAQVTTQSTQPRGAATVEVRVVGDNGTPLDGSADVTISPGGEGSGQSQSTGSNGVARFSRVVSGSYAVSVRMPGYKDALSEVQVPTNYGSFDTTVVMQPEPSVDSDAKGTLLAPKAKKELSDGIAAMRLGHYDEAQKHLEAAYKLAPGDPDVNAGLGELFLVSKEFTKAEDYLARALSIDPDDVSALTDMGQLRLQQRDYVSAEAPLERAIYLAPQNWFAHWLLGVAYLRVNENEKARLEAVAAMKFGKAAANDAGYLLGESLAALGRNIEAIQALQAFVKASPSNSYSSAAQALILKLQTGQSPAAALPSIENLAAPR